MEMDGCLRADFNAAHINDITSSTALCTHYCYQSSTLPIKS